ncbi:MAG: cyclic nucleotide-binding domain-containing protein [Trueperaceae bacterium]|nr:MAG: cyclic nucleotide-binding domain-containing protein [Trueperaceae bacterium]
MVTRDLSRSLAQHAFFRGMDEKHLVFLAGCAKNVLFDQGTFIFREGEKAGVFYLLRYGQVALEVHGPRKGQIRFQSLHEDDVLGWSWLFPPYTWHFDARALSLVRAFAFDGVCVREKCDADHELGYQLMSRFAEVMVGRLQAARLQCLDLYGAPA